MRPSRLPGGQRVTTKNVLVMSNRFQMIWSHTARVAAQVVECKAIRDQTDEVFVRNPMHVHHSSPEAYVPVALVVYGTQPHPAILLFGSAKNPLDQLLHA
jgi:hypothetical protein